MNPDIRLARVAALVACMFVIFWPKANAYTGSTSPTQEEASGFMWGLARQRCDDAWFEAHLTPAAKLTFEITGETPIAVGRDDYLKRFRGRCRYLWAQPSYDQRNASFQQQPGQTVIRLRWTGGSASVFYFEDAMVDAVEETAVLIRSEADVKAQRVHTVGMRVSQQTKSSGSAKRP